MLESVWQVAWVDLGFPVHVCTSFSEAVHSQAICRQSICASYIGDVCA